MSEGSRGLFVSIRTGLTPSNSMSMIFEVLILFRSQIGLNDSIL